MSLRGFADGVEWCDTIHDHYWKLSWIEVCEVTNDIQWIKETLESLLGGTCSIHWTTARLGYHPVKIIAEESRAVGSVVTVVIKTHK
jgi:hypothetical protein